MQISSVTKSLQTIQGTIKQPKAASSSFADFISASSQRSIGVDSTQPTRSQPALKADFKNMTPAEFKDQAKAMYDNGEIDLHTLGVMQLHSNTPNDEAYGSVGGGKFDFTAIFKARMDFETHSGHRNSSLSGYKTYEAILAKITSDGGVNLLG